LCLATFWKKAGQPPTDQSSDAVREIAMARNPDEKNRDASKRERQVNAMDSERRIKNDEGDHFFKLGVFPSRKALRLILVI
jgi:hypothetical protein